MLWLNAKPKWLFLWAIVLVFDLVPGQGLFCLSGWVACQYCLSDIGRPSSSARMKKLPGWTDTRSSTKTHKENVLCVYVRERKYYSLIHLRKSKELEHFYNTRMLPPKKPQCHVLLCWSTANERCNHTHSHIHVSECVCVRCCQGDGQMAGSMNVFARVSRLRLSGTFTLERKSSFKGSNMWRKPQAHEALHLTAAQHLHPVNVYHRSILLD